MALQQLPHTDDPPRDRIDDRGETAQPCERRADACVKECEQHDDGHWHGGAAELPGRYASRRAMASS